jgi:hypothetical protein
MRFPVLLLAVTLAGGVPTVGAQTPSSAVASGTRIFVTLAAGGPPVEGWLLALSLDSVALMVDATTWTLPLNQVRRIQREGDRSIAGAAIGALAVGARCAYVCGQALSGNRLTQAVLVNAVLGGLVGWAVDRGHVGRTTIYPVTPDSRDTPYGRR